MATCHWKTLSTGAHLAAYHLHLAWPLPASVDIRYVLCSVCRYVYKRPTSVDMSSFLPHCKIREDELKLNGMKAKGPL